MRKPNCKRIVRRIVAGLGLILIVLAVYTYIHWSPGAPPYRGGNLAAIDLPYRFREGKEHDAALARNGGNPYVLEIDPAGRGAILYYGASHTTDPDHSQLADIASRWKAFSPTVALCEGRARGFFYGALIEPFAGLPEPAFVHKLARTGGVTLYSLEPAYEAEVRALLEQFEPKQVALYFFLRVYASEAGGVANETLAADLLAKRTKVEGLRGTLASLADVDRVWNRDFPGHEDWRTLTGEPDDTYLEKISHESRRIRGEHMCRVLIDLANQGERVFAVVGSGHVIRQEWNLRSVFGMEPAWDQRELESNYKE